ncbi:hypothetical protein [Cohnella fermenti]|uniref:Uncharacterized protein n=1 Tax=Cohnella fermenti TaxID=2565925 RepID=A0A4S4BFB2_9BACL|nr:hypothetical protein [Cohnella fermenti]THF72717.1 hypothetical protein E6C55_32250 [Cohnella fermenti]
MSSYRKALRTQAILAVFLACNSGIQAAIQLREGRGIGWFFVALILVFITLALLLFIDLASEGSRLLVVRVLRVNEDRLTVLKPNGRSRALRIVRLEKGIQPGDELALTLTKRTRQVIGVKLHSGAAPHPSTLESS